MSMSIAKLRTDEGSDTGEAARGWWTRAVFISHAAWAGKDQPSVRQPPDSGPHRPRPPGQASGGLWVGAVVMVEEKPEGDKEGGDMTRQLRIMRIERGEGARKLEADTADKKESRRVRGKLEAAAEDAQDAGERKERREKRKKEESKKMVEVEGMGV
ncbi:hypothetical protein BGX38DRAFT_1276730 [Terfezia claveryi]|nr:hypothetical protein BGX38DRAFT_1276730 [Terfezia claveryi]